MAQTIKKDETVALEEVVIFNVYTQEALINVLVKKGLISKEEIIDEINRLKTSTPEGKLDIINLRGSLTHFAA